MTKNEREKMRDELQVEFVIVFEDVIDRRYMFTRCRCWIFWRLNWLSTCVQV